MKGWVELTAHGGKRTWFQVRNLLAVRKAGSGSEVVDNTPHTEESNPVWAVAEPLEEVLLRIEAAGVIK